MTLVLHFDINGTITPVDTVEPGSKIENANMVISKSVFGTIIDNKWVLNTNIYDEIDSITYYDHLKQINKNNYKKISFTFTNKGEPGEILNYLVQQLVDSMDKFLFDSFLNVLSEFPHAQIIFRTFGLDADEVIEYLRTNETTTNKFKTIPKGLFTNVDNEYVLTLENNESFIGMSNINKLFKITKQHFALKENYNYWNDNDRSKLFGKQLLGDGDMIQIFFDDNDCVNVIDDTNVHNIRINTLHAMVDNKYYIDKIYDILNK